MLLVILAAQNAAQPGPFLLGALFWLGPVLGFGLCMARAQQRYLQLYRTVRGGDLRLPGESTEHLQNWPSGWLRLSWKLYNVIWEPQSNPELEAARRRVVRYWRLAVLWGVIGVVLPIAFSLALN